MSKVLVLTKVLFKNAFLASSEKNKFKNLIITFSIIGILMITSYGIPLIIGMGEFVSWLAPVVDPSILLEMFLPSIIIIVLLMSVVAIISYYYLSTDISLLLPMPFKPKEILLARFILVTLSLYFFEFVFFGPVLIGYGVGVGASVMYYVYALLFLITAPFIPVSFMSVIITSLMRIGNFSANKDRFTYIVMFLSIAFGIGVSMIPTAIDINIDPTEFANIISEVEKVTNYFVPFLRPAINALKDSTSIFGFLWFVLYLALSVGAVYLFLIISSNVYIKGVMVGGNAKKKNKRQRIDTEKSIQSGSAFKSYTLKEWRLIVRTPVYNTNLVLVELIFVIILAGSFIFGITSEGGDINKILSEITKFKLSSQLSYILLFVLGGILFLNGISLISASAISREGKAAYFMKYIPMPPLKQINAKIIIGIFMHLLLPVLVFIGALLIGVIDILQFFYILIPTILISVFLNYWGILVDLTRPKLNWDNETVAVKQNLNGVIFMLICYALAIIFMILGFLLLFIDNIRKTLGQFNTALIPTLVGIALFVISIIVILSFVKKIKSLVRWMILLNIFTLFIILGGILTFGGIMEFVHYTYQVNAGIGLWSLVITLILGLATYILVKSISLKGDAIFDNID